MATAQTQDRDRGPTLAQLWPNVSRVLAAHVKHVMCESIAVYQSAAVAAVQGKQQ